MIKKLAPTLVSMVFVLFAMIDGGKMTEVNWLTAIWLFLVNSFWLFD